MRALKYHQEQKNHQMLYYFIHFLISQSAPHYRQNTLTHANKKTVFISHKKKSLISNIYLSYLYDLNINLSLASQTICEHMLSYPKLDHNFHIFGCIIGLYIFSYCMWKLYTYFEDGKLLKLTVGWFLIESNQLQPWYYFLTNTELNSKYYLGNYFENGIE